MDRLLALAVLCVSLAGCQCWQPEHRNEPACAILHEVIDCTKDAALSTLAPAAAKVIAGLLSANPTADWNEALRSLEDAGIKDGGCVLAYVQAELNTKMSVSPGAKKRDVLAGVKMKANAQYKIKLPDGREVLR
jgi:hypothetical protein